LEYFPGFIALLGFTNHFPVFASYDNGCTYAEVPLDDVEAHFFSVSRKIRKPRYLPNRVWGEVSNETFGGLPSSTLTGKRSLAKKNLEWQT
jgi:hypothetical protein